MRAGLHSAVLRWIYYFGITCAYVALTKKYKLLFVSIITNRIRHGAYYSKIRIAPAL